MLLTGVKFCDPGINGQVSESESNQETGQNAKNADS